MNVNNTNPDASLIGNYRVVEKIGEGGMGQVFCAVDTMLERRVALKALHAHLTQDVDRAQRFRSEAITLARLQHPNIATLHQFFEHGGAYYMVMEYVDGETFESLVRRMGALPLRQSLELFTQALHGFEHAHENQVIHRDIKPSNLMLNRRGLVKITDFGIARVVGGGRLTQTGKLIGTLEYMSPEQVQGLEQDARSDIYSLGILLYEMITGRMPFSATSDFEIMRAHLEATPTPAREVITGLPEEVELVLQKALAKNPADRIQSVREMREMLEPVITRLPKAQAAIEPTIKETRMGDVMAPGAAAAAAAVPAAVPSVSPPTVAATAMPAAVPPATAEVAMPSARPTVPEPVPAPTRMGNVAAPTAPTAPVAAPVAAALAAPVTKKKLQPAMMAVGGLLLASVIGFAALPRFMNRPAPVEPTTPVNTEVRTDTKEDAPPKKDEGNETKSGEDKNTGTGSNVDVSSIPELKPSEPKTVPLPPPAEAAPKRVAPAPTPRRTTAVRAANSGDNDEPDEPRRVRRRSRRVEVEDRPAPRRTRVRVRRERPRRERVVRRERPRRSVASRPARRKRSGGGGGGGGGEQSYIRGLLND